MDNTLGHDNAHSFDNTDNKLLTNIITDDEAIKSTCYVNTLDDENKQAITLKSRPLGLRRHPTKYPLGLGISVQTVATDADHVPTYSRASILRSNWDNRQSDIHTPIQEQMHSEHLAELQVRRYKYSLTRNYYLDTQESKEKPTLMLVVYAKRCFRWKYLRWPFIFAASVLLFFGLLTYCIWLHDVSVARDRYLLRRQYLKQASMDDDLPPNELNTETDKIEMPKATWQIIPTERGNVMHESTMLRSIGTRSRQNPKIQKLATPEYAFSKDVAGWDKERKDGSTTPTNEANTLVAEEAALVPTNIFRFTSGHQNSFGVPIEDDERILMLINDLLPVVNPPELSTSNTPTKVSPTIPPVPQSSSTLPKTAPRPTIQETGCYSTSLPICQGVLDYDLTYNATTNLTIFEQEGFQKLINSNCSMRAVEFICATLEPECRPSHIGVLPPCRRICKAILEACSVVIGNSDILTATFDCNLYPDSNDAHKCEDPTRRHDYCFDNEFECFDGTCIPQQWQCDNIKDCTVGEDEEHCLLCDHADEFRCRSNEKCVAETVRCDLKYDCFDGSDEDNCEEYGSGETITLDEPTLNAFPRTFSYASYLSPNQSNDKLYTYITARLADDESSTKFQVHEITNRTTAVSKEEVTNSMPSEGDPKGFVNFRESKEIMMTSDSENKFKYSAARANRNSSKYETNTTPLKPAASMRFSMTTKVPPKIPPEVCTAHQLRCVSGKCIIVAQLCDKKIDCPDGADELMCNYKERSTTVRNNDETSTTLRADKRTIRTTTIKRKLRT